MQLRASRSSRMTCALPASAALAGTVERRVPGLCAGECFAHLQRATADNAALRQENANLRAQLQRADEAVDASQSALEALRVESRAIFPPISAESCKLFVTGLSVGSQRTFASEFTKLCRDCLDIPLTTVNVSVVGVDTHGLSRAVVKLQTVAEAKRIMEAGKRLLTPRCNVRICWNRSRAARVDRAAARRSTGRAQGRADDSPSSLALAALFVPAARSHDVTACNSALASASDSAAAALAALLAHE